MVPRRLSAVAAWAVIVSAAVWITSSQLQIENPRGLWTVSPDPPAHQLWEFTQQLFGDRDVLLVGLQIPPESIQPVDSAASTLQQWIREQSEVEQALGVEQLRALRRQLGPFGGRLLSGLRDAVIGRDNAIALTYVVLVSPATSGSLDVKRSFLSRLRAASPDLLPSGATLHLAGQPAIDVALDQLLRDDFANTVPLALLALGVALLLLIGRLSLAAVATVTAGLLVLLSGMALAGTPVSSATAVALPLTVVVGISYAAHVALAVARTNSARAALREIGPPLMWSYLTTVVAIGSFALSPIHALRLFAVASCAGLTFAFVAALTLTPFVVSGRSRGWARRARRLLTSVGVRIFGRAVRHSRATISIWVVMMAVVVLGVLRVRLEPNSYLSFFPRGHEIARAYETIDAAFGGSVPLHVVARADSGVALRQDRVRTRLEAFLRLASEQTQVGPILQPPPARILESGGELDADMAGWFKGRDERYTRAMFAVPIMATEKARQAIDDLEALAQAHSDEEVSLFVTGLLPATLPMQQMLVSLMIKSLGLLLAFVVLALLLASRSLRGGLALVTPNVVAVLAVLAAMGYLGIPIDFTTVSVASLVLGVAVDDTLQLTWAGRGFRGSPAYHPSRAVRRTAAPVLLASVAMIAGAVTLMASPFTPTHRLGGLLAVGLLIALAADLTLTPLVIARWSGERRASSAGPTPY